MDKFEHKSLLMHIARVLEAILEELQRARPIDTTEGDK